MLIPFQTNVALINSATFLKLIMIEEIENKRKVSAKVCGLVDRGWKYNKLTPEDEHLDERFFCRSDKWKPDQNWDQFMYLASNLKMSFFKERFTGISGVSPSNTPESDFKYLMSKLK